MAVLVDSSVWIAAAKIKSKECQQLRELIQRGHPICVSLPIKVEVCQGARSKTEFDKLWDAFEGFFDLPLRDDIWEHSAWNYYRCRKAGITPSTLDCFIATLASTYRVELWTLDKIFTKMKDIIGFDLAC